MGLGDSLSRRERRMVMGLVLFLGVVVGGGLAWTLKSRLDDKASKVRMAKDNYEILVAMEERFLEADAVIKASETRLREYAGVRLDAHVEKIATQTGVSEQLRSVDEQGTETVGNVMQRRYRIDLRKVTVAQALDFIYDLETSGYPVSVERANLKTVFVSGERLLNVRLEVVTLSIEEGA